jgi:hypothetical protein
VHLLFHKEGIRLPPSQYAILFQTLY